MDNYKGALLIGLGAVAAFFAVLYAKNSIQQKQFKPLQKNKVIAIIKQIRKDSYSVYRQIVIPFHMQVVMQVRGQITAEQFKELLESPESGVNFKAKMQQITQKACESQDTTVDIFEQSLQFHSKDREVLSKKSSLEREYQMALMGKLSEEISINPPEVTKQRLLEIQNRIVKEKMMISVDMMRKLTGKSEADLMRNPGVLAEMRNPEAEEDRILAEQGFDDTDEPANALYLAAVKRMCATNTQFKMEFANVELKYKKVVERYASQFQRTHNPAVLQELQQEIIFMP